MSVQSIYFHKCRKIGDTILYTKKGVSSLVPLMIMVCFLILLLALDFHFGRKAFEKKAYEPVFQRRKAILN